MIAICVDDEPLVLQLTVSLCKELPALRDAVGFSRAQEALDWLDSNFADIALLDIDMPDMNGLALAAKIKEKHPDTAIIFLTGYAQYAVDAFGLHVSGYLLKPVVRDKLAAEVEHALKDKKPREGARISVQTFGNFEVIADGKNVAFDRSKAKELLAYLVDRHGKGVSRAEIFAALWEEGDYDRSMQKQLDVIIRSLRATLREFGIENILEINKGVLRICPEKLDCDLYRFLQGDVDSVNAYRGEYMSPYPWANMTEAYMTRNTKRLRE